ncbi:hypothetical protein TIFTF001_014804 [Ficus carica]|uniref:Uncharacterized protein n=1 Tax=Ficus carica TaxID=3494 RepID=A0AA88A049_FICCA|nr:hypothetical protein TIFTF001_014804 [Ficus carica]
MLYLPNTENGEISPAQGRYSGENGVSKAAPRQWKQAGQGMGKER